MPHTQRALIIFPTYNERENIEKIVHAVLPLGPRMHVLIVDDDSQDGTSKISDRLPTDHAQPPPYHTLNPVPCALEPFDSAWKGRRLRQPEEDPAGIASAPRLADVAPTLLKLLGLAQPPEMTGRSLLI